MNNKTIDKLLKLIEKNLPPKKIKDLAIDDLILLKVYSAKYYSLNL